MLRACFGCFTDTVGFSSRFVLTFKLCCIGNDGWKFIFMTKRCDITKLTIPPFFFFLFFLIPTLFFLPLKDANPINSPQSDENAPVYERSP